MTYTVAQNNRESLCALREDIKLRSQTTAQFLSDHPNGIPGISKADLKLSLYNQQRTLKSLSGLDCG